MCVCFTSCFELDFESSCELLFIVPCDFSLKCDDFMVPLSINYIKTMLNTHTNVNPIIVFKQFII